MSEEACEETIQWHGGRLHCLMERNHAGSHQYGDPSNPTSGPQIVTKLTGVGLGGARAVQGPTLERSVTQQDLDVATQKEDPRRFQRERIPRAEPDNWAHRNQNLRCATCMWFARKRAAPVVDREDPRPVGRCRRHAPTMSGWPVMFDTDWCGDFKLDENKA